MRAEIATRFTRRGIDCRQFIYNIMMEARSTEGQTAPMSQLVEDHTDDAESRDLGHKVRTLRSERRMSIADLATKAGVSAGIISQIERGKSNPSMKTLQRIRAALGVSLWAFLEQPKVVSQDPMFVRRADERLRIVVGPNKLIKELLSPINHESLRRLSSAPAKRAASCSKA